MITLEFSFISPTPITEPFLRYTLCSFAKKAQVTPALPAICDCKSRGRAKPSEALRSLHTYQKMRLKNIARIREWEVEFAGYWYDMTFRANN